MKLSRYRWFVILLIVAGAGTPIYRGQRVPEVRVYQAHRSTLSAEFSSTGFVESTEVTISSKVVGRVVTVRVHEGDVVRRGQPLLIIEKQELSAAERAARAGEAAAESHARAASLNAQAFRAEAPAQVQQACSALAEAEAQLSRLRHGSRPEEIREARAAWQQAASGVKLAKTQLATAEVMLEQQQKLSRAQVREAEAALAAAKAMDEQVRRGLRPQEVAQAEAAWRDMRSRHALADKEYQRIASLYRSGAISKQQVDQAQSALAVSKEAARQAEERLSLAKEGARREEREASRAQVEAAEARLNEARAAAEQVRVRQQEVEAARTQTAQAEAALAAAEARAQLVETGPRREDIEAARARVSQARAAVGQARSALIRVGAQTSESLAARAQSQQAAAQREQASIQLAETVIRSPIDGAVARRLVDIGELVAPSTPLLPGTELIKIVDSRKRWVIAEVDAEDLGKVYLGQEVNVTAEAFPGRTFPGSVTIIGPTAEPKPGGRTRARIVRVKVSLLSPAPELKPGLEVDVRGRATLSRGALVVPNDAVIHKEKDFVWVLRGDRVTRRAVAAGKRNEVTCEVTSGLSDGERVVVRGKEGLREGDRVKVMNR